MKRLSVAAAGFGCALAVLFWVPVASAADVQCSNNQTLTGSVTGNVTVPSGAFCTILDATITGNLTAQGNANVVNSTITGNVTAQGNATVGVLDSAIEGNYNCNNCEEAVLYNSGVGGNFQGSAEKKGSFIFDGEIKGDLAITTSSAGGVPFLIESTAVGGNLTFNNNTGTSTIEDNTITGNLQCQNNVPAPSTFNNAAKSHQGQCTS